MTSCGRFDLLAETLRTFVACNTAPIARWLVVEDSGREEVRDVVRVEVWEDRSLSLCLLFDPEHNLDERILKEQFIP